MIIFIRIVLIYFIIGCVIGLFLNWAINSIFADKAKWLNRKPKEKGMKNMIIYCVFLWPLVVGAGIYIAIKDESKIDDKITDIILDDDFYDEEES